MNDLPFLWRSAKFLFKCLQILGSRVFEVFLLLQVCLRLYFIDLISNSFCLALHINPCNGLCLNGVVLNSAFISLRLLTVPSTTCKRLSEASRQRWWTSLHRLKVFGFNISELVLLLWSWHLELLSFLQARLFIWNVHSLKPFMFLLRHIWVKSLSKLHHSFHYLHLAFFDFIYLNCLFRALGSITISRSLVIIYLRNFNDWLLKLLSHCIVIRLILIVFVSVFDIL